MSKLLYVYQNYRKSYSSASLSILRGLMKIEELEVMSFEIKPLSYSNNINRVINKLPLLQKTNIKKQNENLKKVVAKEHFDFLFAMKGTDVHASTLKAIKTSNPGLKLICFNPDDPFNRASSNDDIVSTIPLYDFYCIWTRLLNDQLKKAGAKEIIYLPFGIDSEIIYPVNADNEFDISFIGNGDTERHQLIKSLNDEVVKRGLDYKIHIFGSNWPNLGSQTVIHDQQNGLDLLKTIASSKINLNLLRKQNKNSINMRTFEIPAANGFMLHEISKEAETFFDADKEVVYFNSTEDLVDKCERYLKEEVLREDIKRNSQKKMKSNDYSYHRFLKDGLTKVILKEDI
jgi:spore maturation protein CgeB